MISLHQPISQMCATLGQNRLLVQGAGGNVSWKENRILWVKGSGTWLANANNEDIFVPVDLQHLQNALSCGEFEVTPQIINNLANNNLRPSIETVLHALMPQKIVVHLHAINPLSFLISKDCEVSIAKICQQKSINGVFVGYQKPGPNLARAIYKNLQNSPNADVIFLKNHGIVIGADSTEKIHSLLEKIDTAFTPFQIAVNPLEAPVSAPQSSIKGYVLFDSPDVQSIAFDQNLFKRLRQDWVLFPDHAVFLGATANVYSSIDEFERQDEIKYPELIFIKNVGVFTKPKFNKAKIAQLLCYFDVINRVSPQAQLDPLDRDAINDLLNWDAEKLRQQMAS